MRPHQQDAVRSRLTDPFNRLFRMRALRPQLEPTCNAQRQRRSGCFIATATAPLIRPMLVRRTQSQIKHAGAGSLYLLATVVWDVDGDSRRLVLTQNGITAEQGVEFGRRL